MAEERRHVTGVIREVLESHPPQLVLDSGTDTLMLALADDASILVGDRSAGFEVLMPGARIRVRLVSFDADAQAGVVDRVEVLPPA